MKVYYLIYQKLAMHLIASYDLGYYIPSNGDELCSYISLIVVLKGQVLHAAELMEFHSECV